MARRVSPWLAAPVLAIVALSVAYLPPKGAAWPDDDRFNWSGRPGGTPEQVRAMEITRQWQQAEIAVRLAAWRARLAPELQRRRAADLPTLAIALDGSFADSARQWLESGLDDAWRALDLGTTKIGVGVVVSLEEAGPGSDLPHPIVPYSPAYYLPDSTDRHTCVVLATPSRQIRTWLKHPGDESRQKALWLRRVLGPCAFHAAFGKPGPTVARWLSARSYDVALDATWDSKVARGAEGWWILEFGAANRRWMWNWLYRLPAGVAGCAGGRAAACAAYATTGATSQAQPRTTIATNFEWRTPPLPGVTELLSDALREFGRARFARFWTTDLPVDSAFHVAMDTTLGEWVLSRQRAHGTTLVVGPAPPLGASVIGLGVAALALVLAVAAAIRRQVA